MLVPWNWSTKSPSNTMTALELEQDAMSIDHNLSCFLSKEPCDAHYVNKCIIFIDIAVNFNCLWQFNYNRVPVLWLTSSSSLKIDIHSSNIPYTKHESVVSLHLNFRSKIVWIYSHSSSYRRLHRTIPQVASIPKSSSTVRLHLKMRPTTSGKREKKSNAFWTTVWYTSFDPAITLCLPSIAPH